MHRAAHSSSQALGGGPPGLITPHCETLWCSLCGRSAGRSDSCASREPPSLAWLDNWQPRGTPFGPTSSRVCKPHLMTPPVSQGFGCWGLMRGVWHHQDRRRRGPHSLTGIVDHSRGGSPHGAGPLPGTERTPSTINSKTPPASSIPFTSSSSLATLQVRCVVASSIKTHPPKANAWPTLHPAPTSLSHPRNRSPGPDPTQVEGRLLGLLRYRRSKQRLHGSHQRTLSSWADAPP